MEDTNRDFSQAHANTGPLFPSAPALSRTRKSTNHTPPTDAQLRRFLERRHALELGYELPFDTFEAAEYVGLHPKTVERMARRGEIPAHPISGARRKTWRYYRTELDEWLRGRVNSRRYPCSPNGKDSVN